MEKSTLTTTEFMATLAGTGSIFWTGMGDADARVRMASIIGMAVMVSAYCIGRSWHKCCKEKASE